MVQCCLKSCRCCLTHRISLVCQHTAGFCHAAYLHNKQAPCILTVCLYAEALKQVQAAAKLDAAGKSHVAMLSARIHHATGSYPAALGCLEEVFLNGQEDHLLPALLKAADCHKRANHYEQARTVMLQVRKCSWRCCFSRSFACLALSDESPHNHGLVKLAAS